MKCDSNLRWAAAIGIIGAGVLLNRPGGAVAAEGICQLVDSTSGPTRQILRCPSGPTVEAEAAADMHVIDPGGGAMPTSARLGAGAVLLDVPPGYPGGFQVVTPRALATVRGTRWLVDVQPTRTSVFVVRGEVMVQRPTDDHGVTLKAGQGTDVGDGKRPLRVVKWPPKRAAALLARFGQ